MNWRETNDVIKKVANLQRNVYDELRKLECLTIDIEEHFNRDCRELKLQLAQSQMASTADKMNLYVYLAIAINKNERKQRAFLSANERDVWKNKHIELGYDVDVVDQRFIVDVTKSLADGIVRKKKVKECGDCSYFHNGKCLETERNVEPDSISCIEDKW